MNAKQMIQKKQFQLEAENERLRATNAHLMAKAAERDDLININAELLAALKTITSGSQDCVINAIAQAAIAMAEEGVCYTEE